MQQRISNFKRGDTFALTAAIKDESGNPLTIEPANLKSQIRDSYGKLFAELVVTNTETVGSYLLTASSTSNWPTDTTLYMDIQLNTSGQIRSSETIEISVIKDVTQ